MADQVLLVDDDQGIRESLERILQKSGYEYTSVASLASARGALKERSFDALLLDLKLSDGDGMDLLGEIKSQGRREEVIVITGHGTVEMAVSAVKKGAYDFLQKPFDKDELLATLRRVTEKVKLVSENVEMRRKIAGDQAAAGIVGNAPGIENLKKQIEQVAKTNAAILILGESGTGKELIADSLHRYSLRSQRPIVKFNCAALPENLMETELFGHEKGAFTGAVQQKKGRFEIADGGTIFLDEIGELPLLLQPKLLRVLQDGTFERVGGTTTLKVDVRVVAATNRDLSQQVKENKFREDLFYRLDVIRLQAPPLRQHREDLPLLIKHCLELVNKKNGLHLQSVSEQVVEEFRKYDWPGNVRELFNTVERAGVLATGPVITQSQLFRQESGRTSAGDDSVVFKIGTPLEKVKEDYMQACLDFFGHNIEMVAQKLEIASRTLYRKKKEQVIH